MPRVLAECPMVLSRSRFVIVGLHVPHSPTLYFSDHPQPKTTHKCGFRPAIRVSIHRCLMSALGQKQTFAVQKAMSAYPQERPK
jgi:hypothetical protein